MKYAYNNNGVLHDVVMTHPSIIFPAGYAEQFISVPDDAQNGWVWDGTNATEQVSSETLDEIKSRKWLEIKAYRDNLTQQGGYKAQNKWFHSDTFSRSQQLGLVIMGSSIPIGLQWKTMDGSFVEMTPALAQAVFQAAALHDSLLFTYAEQLNQQVKQSTDPNSVDITQGWPETYQGV